MQYDLNLLKAFNCLYQERSVSRAAARLHMSQPAMSAQLAKLRTLFKDPLFARGRYGIQPTDKAQRLAPDVQRALDNLDALVLTEQEFVAHSAPNIWTIAGNDYFADLILPLVIKALADKAPQSHLQFVELNQDVTEAGMMSDDIHLAFGRINTPPDNIVLTQVLQDSLCCIGDKSYWTTRAPLTMEAYEAAQHVVVKPSGKLTTGVFKQLEERGIHRNSRYAVPHFHLLPALLSDSGMLATVPQRIASQLAEQFDIVCMMPPVAFEPIPFHLAWHSRYQQDPAQRWLRELVKHCSETVAKS